jgi:hypothetical protein
VAGCCECGDEPSGSGATELVSQSVSCTCSAHSILLCGEKCSLCSFLHAAVTFPMGRDVFLGTSF